VDQRVTTHLSNLAASQHIDLATLEKAIRVQLGLSMAQYRDQLAEQIREHLYMTRIRQLHVGSMNPTNKEVVEFFNAYKDSLPRVLTKFS
jgi:peptidyl-prolyl cis-trans isomerase SurA